VCFQGDEGEKINRQVAVFVIRSRKEDVLCSHCALPGSESALPHRNVMLTKFSSKILQSVACTLICKLDGCIRLFDFCRKSRRDGVVNISLSEQFPPAGSHLGHLFPRLEGSSSSWWHLIIDIPHLLNARDIRHARRKRTLQWNERRLREVRLRELCMLTVKSIMVA